MNRPHFAWLRSHPILAGALACALVGTANAEYTLATGTHVNEYVALAVPGALDLYFIQALRVHRDVAAAVLVVVAVNVASHLLTAGLYPDGYWWDFGITAGVGALAPGIVWRVHALERTRNRAELLWGLEAGAMKSPDECTAPEVPSAPECTALEAPSAPALEQVSALEYASAPVPDSVPEAWTEYEFPSAGPVPYLTVVPAPECTEDDVPEGASAVHLNLRDEEYIASAAEYVASTGAPSVRGLMKYASVGQPRAGRLLAHLGVKP
jgi:hypothetical protein